MSFQNSRAHTVSTTNSHLYSTFMLCSNMVKQIPLSSVLLETDLPHLEQIYFLCWRLYVLEYFVISVSTLIWLPNVSSNLRWIIPVFKSFSRSLEQFFKSKSEHFWKQNTVSALGTHLIASKISWATFMCHNAKLTWLLTWGKPSTFSNLEILRPKTVCGEN